MNTDTMPLVIAAACIVGVTAIVFRYLNGQRAVFLSDGEYVPVRLVAKTAISPDTRVFRFALEHPTQTLGLPIGQHMSLRATIGGEVVTRSYTPISSDDDKGFVEFVIKVYFANVHPKFPDGGKMSQHMERMQVGDTLDVRGPVGRFDYRGKGQYKIKQGATWVNRDIKKVGLIAGGTGITPVLQLVRSVLKDPSDRTEMWLLFANHTEADILLRKELEECAKDPRCRVHFTLSMPPAEGWTHSRGRIDADMIAQHMPMPDASTIVLMCGPPPMVQLACKPNLEKHGFTAEQMFAF